MDHWWVFPVTVVLTSTMAVLAFGCGLRLALKDLRRAEETVSDASRGSAVTHALHVVVGDMYVRMLPLYPGSSRGSSLDGAPLPQSLRPTLQPRFQSAPELAFRAPDRASDTGVACAICLEPLSDAKGALAAGKCGHWMHAPCLRAWLAKDAAQLCPICRMCLAGEPQWRRTADESSGNENAGPVGCP